MTDGNFKIVFEKLRESSNEADMRLAAEVTEIAQATDELEELRRLSTALEDTDECTYAIG